MQDSAIGLVEKPPHTPQEFANVHTKHLVDDWLETDLPSQMIIPSLHKEVMQGIAEYSKKGLQPLPLGKYRDTDLLIDKPRNPEQPENFYLRGLDVPYVMVAYTKQLDAILEKLPRSPQYNVERVIGDAAWAYYVFGRMHPFLDGNGRIGRIILKRIMKAAGFRDLQFHDSRFMNSVRSEHLDALEHVDKTHNLAHLEIFLLHSLLFRYHPQRDKKMYDEIKETIVKKETATQQQADKRSLTDVWKGFDGLDIAGVNIPPEYISSK